MSKTSQGPPHAVQGVDQSRLGAEEGLQHTPPAVTSGNDEPDDFTLDGFVKTIEVLLHCAALLLGTICTCKRLLTLLSSEQTKWPLMCHCSSPTVFDREKSYVA